MRHLFMAIAVAMLAPVALAQTSPATSSPAPEKSYSATDKALTRQPALRDGQREMLAEEYPPRAKRQGLTGVAQAVMCVDRTGRPSAISLIKSSGVPDLDQVTLKYLPRVRFTPGKVGEESVNVCGHTMAIAWGIEGGGVTAQPPAMASEIRNGVRVFIGEAGAGVQLCPAGGDCTVGN